ncbi:MAG: hypothetical protein D6746_10460 [Bacteroidetes bacterium]|nr:MAG: hypothetical protein D6746_10460 [Bacteroidota bacterium]
MPDINIGTIEGIAGDWVTIKYNDGEEKVLHVSTIYGDPVPGGIMLSATLKGQPTVTFTYEEAIRRTMDLTEYYDIQMANVDGYLLPLMPIVDDNGELIPFNYVAYMKVDDPGLVAIQLQEPKYYIFQNKVGVAFPLAEIVDSIIRDGIAKTFKL